MHSVGLRQSDDGLIVTIFHSTMLINVYYLITGLVKQHTWKYFVFLKWENIGRLF